MSKSINIAFFSSSDFAIPLIQKLQQINNKSIQEIYNQESQNWTEITFNYQPKLEQITAILQKYGDYKINFKLVISASDKLNRTKIVSNPVVQYCKSNQIEYYNPNKLKENYGQFKSQNTDLNLGIVASYGQILTEEVLNSFEFGIINWHPSLLPKYRGPTPMQTILNKGEQETGLSWIYMTQGMDAGDILLQTESQLPNNWNITDLSFNMVETGCKTLILAILSNLGYQDKSLNLQIGEKQNLELVTFTKMLDKSFQIIKPVELTANQIFNHFKAYKEFPGTVFYDDYFKQNIKIISATAIVSTLDNLEIIFQTSNFIQVKDQNIFKTYLKSQQNYLQLQEIMLENGKKIKLKGYQFKQL